jgi:hypothetical protein
VLYVDRTFVPHAPIYAIPLGEVIRFNPRSHNACVITEGLTDPSDVVFGSGDGWAKTSLFVCGFDGTVRELRPPK